MPTTAPEDATRLQKFLADAGICSRREAERRITDGRVSVNGKTVTEMGIKVRPKDRVTVDGKPVSAKTGKPVYLILNKPAGVVTSCKHEGERVVTDIVKVKDRVYPVGRLDKESTGLLLLTNDGPLHHRLSHPSFDHEKEYLVEVDRSLTDEELKRLATGIRIDGRKTRRAHVERLDTAFFRIVLKEGRNRQIRRMVAALGANVTSLKRIRMANLRLTDLPSGKWRNLSNKEVSELKKLLGENQTTKSRSPSSAGPAKAGRPARKTGAGRPKRETGRPKKETGRPKTASRKPAKKRG